MDPIGLLTRYLLTSIAGGLAGATLMSLVMTLIDRSGIPGRHMVVALGSLLTGSKENARLVGGLLHAAAAVIYGLAYTWLLLVLNLHTWPSALFGGLGLGVFHGIVVSLTLVWIVADQHPLPEYRETGPLVFLEHFAGHVVFGGTVGLVVAFAPLL